MLNKKIFHDFYYGTGNGRGCNSRTHFVRNHFFSYRTEVACVINIIKPVTLISDYGFSATTAVHLSCLRDASPNPLVFVDFNWTDDFTDKKDRQVVQELRKRRVKSLRDHVKYSYRKVDARRETRRLLDNFEALLQAAGIEPNQAEQNLIDKLNDLIDETPQNLAKWKEESRKLAQETRTREAREKKARERKERKVNKTRALVRKWFEEFHPGFGELLEARYKHQFHGDSSHFDFFVKLSSADVGVCNEEIGKELIKLTGVDNSPSYVWVDDRYPDKVVTSQDIRMDIDTVRTAYGAWKRGKLTEGMHLGPYIVQELNDQYVKIGCHRIPMANVTYLADKLQLEA